MKKIILALLVGVSLAFTLHDGDGKKKKLDGRCSGTKYCSACTNCNYCKNCNSGGICGVCSPESFKDKPKPAATKKTAPKKTKSGTKK